MGWVQDVAAVAKGNLAASAVKKSAEKCFKALVARLLGLFIQTLASWILGCMLHQYL
jgi:hypothetical protein